MNDATINTGEPLTSTAMSANCSPSSTASPPSGAPTTCEGIRPHLTEEPGRSSKVDDYHDAEWGICWTTLETTSRRWLAFTVHLTQLLNTPREFRLPKWLVVLYYPNQPERKQTMKLKIIDTAHHRNGVAGSPFDVVLFKVQREQGVKVGVLFDDPGVCAVLDVTLLAAGDIAFGSNTWRGDDYEPVASPGHRPRPRKRPGGRHDRRCVHPAAHRSVRRRPASLLRRRRVHQPDRPSHGRHALDRRDRRGLSLRVCLAGKHYLAELNDQPIAGKETPMTYALACINPFLAARRRRLVAIPDGAEAAGARQACPQGADRPGDPLQRRLLRRHADVAAGRGRGHRPALRHRLQVPQLRRRAGARTTS